MLAILLVSALALASAAGAQQRFEELDTPFVTTPANVVDAMLDMARVAPGERLIDLGSGDGRIVIAAARRGAHAVGIEIDPQLVERSRVAARGAGVEDRVRFVVQDLFDIDLSTADVVTMYLLPDVNRRLRPRLLATLRPGARIVSHDWDLGEWPPDATATVAAPDKRVGREKQSRVFLWIVPARVAGRWQAEARDRTLHLHLVQSYQRVSGVARWGGREYRFADQPVRGSTMEIRAQGAGGETLALALSAEGETLSGSLREGPGSPVALRMHR